MTQPLCICAALLGLAALMLLAQGAAWALTEWRGPVIKLRPLNCRPCLTFWLTLLLLLAVGVPLLGCTLRTATDAVIFAFINFFYIKTKITIYE